jgi:hypothetical protein
MGIRGLTSIGLGYRGESGRSLGCRDAQGLKGRGAELTPPKMPQLSLGMSRRWSIFPYWISLHTFGVPFRPSHEPDDDFEVVIKPLRTATSLPFPSLHLPLYIGYNYRQVERRQRT